MKTETILTSETEGTAFGYYDDEEDDWVDVDPKDKASVASAAKKLKCSPELIDALACSFNVLAAGMDVDLKDLWQRTEP
ncbi:MAG TPA: hypothetical protein VMY98_07765 [Anaerolineae bacterium]|nr:hypothetical protein [Anaerolineae bacterium]